MLAVTQKPEVVAEDPEPSGVLYFDPEARAVWDDPGTREGEVRPVCDRGPRRQGVNAFQTRRLPMDWTKWIGVRLIAKQSPLQSGQGSHGYPLLRCKWGRTVRTDEVGRADGKVGLTQSPSQS